MALDPSAIRSLACVGTATELAGCVGPGCVSQLLCGAALLVASDEAWGEGDKRVEGAARGLLEVQLIGISIYLQMPNVVFSNLNVNQSGFCSISASLNKCIWR